jgi:hypothetical protein
MKNYGNFENHLNAKSLQSYDLQAFVGFDYQVAESGGFEPADPLTSQQFSRLPQSTTLPTLRDKSTNTCRFCK